MPKSIQQYEARAEECVRLANLTDDDMIRAVLLKLRQDYLATADRLRKMFQQPKNT
jgi:hypothetical protein